MQGGGEGGRRSPRVIRARRHHNELGLPPPEQHSATQAGGHRIASLEANFEVGNVWATV